MVIIIDINTIFKLIKNKEYIVDEGIWSIAIEESKIEKDICNLFDNPRVIITANDITDRKAMFVADPFMIKVNSIWYLFYEVYDFVKAKGIIGVSSSRDKKHWKYEGIVLEEEFHLSYPYIFEFEGRYYMIPESAESGYIKLYTTDNFPFDWTLSSNIIKGKYYDSSIFHYNEKWWMFSEGIDNRNKHNLHLFHSESLYEKWREHKCSPIIRDNKSKSRPGGAVFIDNNNNIIRFSQDCKDGYGQAVDAYKITTLTEKSYKEQLIGRCIEKSNKNNTWNKDGMHTFNINLDDDKYIVVNDGYYIQKQNLIKNKFKRIYYKKILKI